MLIGTGHSSKRDIFYIRFTFNVYSFQQKILIVWRNNDLVSSGGKKNSGWHTGDNRETVESVVGVGQGSL